MIERELRTRVAADARRIAEVAVHEDGTRDITTELCVANHQIATGVIEFRSGGVVAGLSYADAVASAVGLPPVNWYHATGTFLSAGATLGLLQGDMARILRAERPLLNLLQRAVGIATATRSFVDLVEGTNARILHTRKTAPGLRLLDITSVLAGGGHLHRLTLESSVMVKDNHWRALKANGRTLTAALEAARTQGLSDCFVEVESADEVAEACSAGATRLLIDNQTPDTVRAWTRDAKTRRPGIDIEATGGITRENIRAYADADVDYISLGVLTHTVRAADVALEIASE